MSSGAIPSQKIILHDKYFGKIHESDTIMFTICSTIKWAEFHFSRANIAEVGLFGNVVYSSVDALPE